MARDRTDWRYLRPALMSLAVAVLVATATVLASGYWRARMQRGFEDAQQRFRVASAQYLALDEQERLLRADYPRFVALQDAGIIGDERRLSWVEAVRDVTTELRLPEASWRIAARQRLQPPAGVRAHHFAVHGSRMTLDLGLPHEGDLFRVLRRLEAARGLYTVAECHLRRARATLQLAPDARNLAARCELVWLTLLPADGEALSL